jgi:hypothetical protein
MQAIELMRIIVNVIANKKDYETKGTLLDVVLWLSTDRAFA